MGYIRVIQWLCRRRPTIQPPEGLLGQQLATQGYCLHCFDLTGTKTRGGGGVRGRSKSFDSGGSFGVPTSIKGNPMQKELMCTLRLSRTLKELCVYQDGHRASSGHSAQITFRVNVSQREEGEVLSTRNPLGGCNHKHI